MFSGYLITNCEERGNLARLVLLTSSFSRFSQTKQLREFFGTPIVYIKGKKLKKRKKIGGKKNERIVIIRLIKNVERKNFNRFYF